MATWWPSGDDILSVRGLTVAFAGSEGTEHVAVKDFSLTIGAGEFVGVMGEPGCGKSTAAMGMMGLVRPPGRIVSGEVHYLGRDLLAMNDAELDAIRGKDIGLIVQSPRTSLHPMLTVGRQIENVYLAHNRVSRRAARARAIEMLQLVGINDPERRVKSYPHELSTGMTQRVLIAMAMSSGPKLLIADEPTSGLDVTIQAQFLDQMWETANRLEYIEVVAGFAAMGAAVVTINTRLAANELEAICRDCGPRVLVVDQACEELARSAALDGIERVLVIGGSYDEWLARAAPEEPDETPEEWQPFAISYTSGTTGTAKGIVLSHRSRVLSCFGMAAEYGCYGPNDTHLAFAPLFHGGGFVFALAAVFFGGFCELLPRFDPEGVLQRLCDGRFTGTFMVPTHFHAILNLGEGVLAGYRNHGLTALVSNAAPLPQVTKEKIVAQFGEGVLHETYGSTEAGIVTNLRPPDQLRKKSCVGLPFVGNRIRLLDDEGKEAAPGEVGELFSTSPYLFNGYWNKPDETTATMRDGWVSAGDMARRDEEGYLYIVDRKNLRRGQRLSARSGGRALAASGGARGGRGRRAGRVLGRADQGFRRPAGERAALARGTDRLRQGEPCRLQGPQRGRFHRRAAAQSGRQGAEAGAQGDGRVSGGAGTIEHRFVVCGGRRVMVRRAGSGPPVVLLHESPARRRRSSP